MIKDFEIVSGTRNKSVDKTSEKTVIPEVLNSRAVDVVADNFDKIVELASSIVEIKKMKVQSDAVIRQMEVTKETLLAEAEAYAIRVKSDTDKTVKKMEVVSNMMQQFYEHDKSNKLSGEEFSKIIIEVINKLE